MTRIASILHLLLTAAWLPCAGAAEDPFAANVRPTEPLSPEEERQSFILPPGFEIQLVAAEPDIHKPMNLAFDARGRLWVTDTVEYPYAAPPDRPGRDTIKILEDADGDGRAEKVTTFAEGLNVPIGIYPWQGGAIAWSIPNIWHFVDRDGDGKADERRKLFGPMGFERDTHGMNNAFRRHFDGWLYACHGFNNETRVAGADGHMVHMQSGNTYRVRLDGARIEQFTWGQVNPFGMTMDPLGNLFTCDCHSRPIYQLLRGGHYESFGKPHDGLGYAPEMMQHLHGSTANGGACYYAADQFPEEFRGSIFTGNVMTSRVNRDSLVPHGSTLLAREEPDLVTTRDPWFRPVDIQLAPDGTIYIADFYNRIIGHYEVPLTHPGRDRERGRIWRVVYRGDAAGTRRPERPGDLSTAGAVELVAALSHPVQTTRTLAMHELVDRVGRMAVEPARSALASAANPHARSHSLWVLHRLGALELSELQAAAAHPDRTVRVHTQRLLSELPTWQAEHRRLALGGLRDGDAFVRRAAADALGRHAAPGQSRLLLEHIAATPAEDTHLLHVLRMALRDHLRDEALFRELAGEALSAAEGKTVAGIALALEHREAGRYLLRRLQAPDDTLTDVASVAKHVVKLVPAEEIEGIAAALRERLRDDVGLQLGLLAAIDEGLKVRGASPPPAVRDWGASLARELLGSTLAQDNAWTSEPLPGAPPGQDPWDFESRRSADGRADRRFIGSIPHGEDRTGILRSASFTVPAKLSFFLAGHDGFPDQPRGEKNLARLVSAESGKVLATAAAPRNDVAQRVEWELGPHVGTKARFEIVDGDSGPAYAWLAAGDWDPPVIQVPAVPPGQAADKQRAAAAIISRLGLATEGALLRRALAVASEPSALQALGAALAAIEPMAGIDPLVSLLGDGNLPAALRRGILELLDKRNEERRAPLIKEAMQTLSARRQADFALGLAGDPVGARELLALVEAGHASARVLQRRGMQARLLAAGVEDAESRLARLTAELPAEDDARRALGEQRRQLFLTRGGNAGHGAAVFEKTCAVCHQVGGKGKVIGPQLDGIGNRGLERLIEDVMDPNRNVDVAFRASTFVLRDGKVLSGLERRREGESIVIADARGEESALPIGDVAQTVRSELSLMPDNVSETVPEADFLDLLAFLLAARPAPGDAPAAPGR